MENLTQVLQVLGSVSLIPTLALVWTNLEEPIKKLIKKTKIN